MDNVKEVKGLVREELRAKFAEKFSGEEIKFAVNYERRFENYLVIIKACSVNLLPSGLTRARVSRHATAEDFSGKALEIVSWVHEMMASFKDVKDYDLYVGDVGTPFEVIEPEVKTPALKKAEIMEKFTASLSTPISVEKDGWKLTAQNIEQEKIGEVTRITIINPDGEVVEETFDEKNSLMVLITIVKNISETGNYKVA